jgi:hypothetical protein
MAPSRQFAGDNVVNTLDFNGLAANFNQVLPSLPVNSPVAQTGGSELLDLFSARRIPHVSGDSGLLGGDADVL